MRQKRAILINDVTGYSRCSVAAMLPIMSAMNIETAFVPTAILSVNTFHKEYYFDDYTERMSSYIETYKKMNVVFDGIATGFMGSAKQIDIVIDFIKYFKNKDNFILIDPVMGDHGKLYPTYNEKMQQKMRELMPYASIVTPNLTELCALLDITYPKVTPTNQELNKMCLDLSKMGPSKIVVTGIDRGNKIDNFVYEDNQDYKVISVERIGDDRSGTGDVISAVITGSYINGLSFYDSVKKATEFSKKCIQYSEDIKADNHLGLCFEPFLKEL